MVQCDEVGSGNSFMVAGDMFIVAFCCHPFKEDVKGSLCRFEFVFCHEEEEAASRFRELCQFDAGEIGNSIHVFDCFDHFREGMWFTKVLYSDRGFRQADSGDGDADEIFISFAVGIKGSKVSFMGHHLFLDDGDKVKHILGVVVANVLEEAFIKEGFGNAVAGCGGFI
jgi:hypothetical protein